MQARDVRRGAALALLGAAAIHAAAAPVHLRDELLHGLFFVVAAGAQGALALALGAGAGRRALRAAGLLSAAVVATWIASRTTGVPGGGGPEPVGLADAVASALELVVVGLALTEARVAAWLPARLATGGLVASAVLVTAATVPAVLAAPEHDHGDGDGHAHAATATATAAHPDPADADAAHADAAHADDGHGAAHGDADADHVDHDGTEPFVFGEDHSHAAEPCDPTPAQQAAADRLLADTKAALPALADPERAEDLGFRRFGDVPISGTWHYINWAWQADDVVLDPARPESVVYWQADADSPMYLIGAMFIAPTAEEHGPQVGGCLTRWHVHGPPFAEMGELTTEMLHVWTIPMPDGPFV